MPQRHNCGYLDRSKHPVIVVRLDGAEGADNIAVASAESDAPTGHVIALAHGCELNSQPFGSFDCQDARAHIAVKGHIGIGEVRDEEKVVLVCQSYDLLIKIRTNNRGTGIMRKIHNHNFGLDCLACFGNIAEIASGVRRVDEHGISGGKSHSVHVRRIGRRRYNHAVTRTNKR